VIERPLLPFGDVAAWHDLRASAVRGPGALQLRWTLASDGADLGTLLRLPSPAAGPRRLDDLWQHTCVEAFVAATDQESYLELNLSPAGDWNVYALQGYRQGLEPLAGLTSLPAHIVRQPQRLQLSVSLPLPPAMAAAPQLAVGLTAVLEDVAGELSYWALHHPAAQADFHHRGGFTLLCPAGDRGPH
jgi:hypothetical protein